MKMKGRVVSTGVVCPTNFSHTGVTVIAEAPTAQPSEPAPPAKPVITIYVRRAETHDPKVKARTISLHPIPDRVSMDEWLDMGFAFDGDTVSVAVDPYTEAALDGDGKPRITSFAEAVQRYNLYHTPWTLTDALRQVQSALVMWLRRLGYEVTIK